MVFFFGIHRRILPHARWPPISGSTELLFIYILIELISTQASTPDFSLSRFSFPSRPLKPFPR